MRCSSWQLQRAGQVSAIDNVKSRGFAQGHEASVEDIQWSPTEGNVFASCSVDRTIRIWDSRVHTAPQLTVTAHASDVNVISVEQSGLAHPGLRG